MLEQLLNLVKEHIGTTDAVPAGQQEVIAQDATHAVEGGIKDALQGGNISDVMHLFSGQSDVTGNPVAQNIQGGFIQNLVSKFGIDASQAGSIASSIIPGVLGKLVNKTNDPGDSSFDLQSIMHHFSGGSTAGFDVQGLMNKFKGGLDKDGDGDVDLQDLSAMFKGGTGGGGLMDTVKGLF